MKPFIDSPQKMPLIFRMVVGIEEKKLELELLSVNLKTFASFSEQEQAALEYARAISTMPLFFSAELVENVKRHFIKREIVILAGTAAQVNYWGRLLQALGIPPAGFTSECRIE